MSALGDSVALTYRKLPAEPDWQRVYAVRCGGNPTNVVVKMHSTPEGQGLWRGFVDGEPVTARHATRYAAADMAMRRAAEIALRRREGR